MRYVLLRKAFISNAGYTGTANTAFTNQQLGIREKLNCQADEIAVSFGASAYLQVTGGNADGDDLFSILQLRSSAGGAAAGTVMRNVWIETIAAASLLANARFYRNLPGDNSETDMRGEPVILNDSEDLFVSATAGGANVIYTIYFYATWYVYKEIKEKYGEETPLAPSSVLSVPSRVGWWQ